MSVVQANMERDDREPHEVINDPSGPYQGDRDAYLRAMADWHGIDIDAIPKDESRVA